MRVWIVIATLGLLGFTALPAGARQTLSPAQQQSQSSSQSRSTARSAGNSTSHCDGQVIAGRCIQLSSARCAANELDLQGICLPAQLETLTDVSLELQTNAHTDRSGRLVVYEHIPRRPDLPADYNRYLYPVPPWHGRTVSSGYDLGQPDALQRRGAELRAVGHGGVDLPHDRGQIVKVIPLRGQVSDPEVYYTGPLFGTTVVLKYVIREGDHLRTYVALHGHLDDIAPGLVNGQTVIPGTVIGFVGDTGATGAVHLHYETRMVRPGLDPNRLDSRTMITSQQVSVACDPRNLLPMQN